MFVHVCMGGAERVIFIVCVPVYCMFSFILCVFPCVCACAHMYMRPSMYEFSSMCVCVCFHACFVCPCVSVCVHV